MNSLAAGNAAPDFRGIKKYLLEILTHLVKCNGTVSYTTPFPSLFLPLFGPKSRCSLVQYWLGIKVGLMTEFKTEPESPVCSFVSGISW